MQARLHVGGGQRREKRFGKRVLTVAQLLAQARRQGLARLDAQLLLAHRLGRPRAWLIAHDEDAVEGGVLFPVYQRANQVRERVRVAVNVAYFFWLK